MTRVQGINRSIIALVAVLVLVAGYLRRWITDDALIIIRTLEQIVAGNGPTFNASERVEANTSTLWQWVLVVVHSVTRLPFETVLLYGCYASAVASVVVVGAAVTRMAHIMGHDRSILIPFGIAAYFTAPVARDFITSGLEWSFATLWLALSWYLGVRYVDAGKGRRWFLLVVGLGWLVRPEFALHTVLLAVWWIVVGQWRKSRAWQTILADYLWMFLVPAAYEVFRMGYYGLLTPETAVVKTGTTSRWHDGVLYIRNFFELNSPWLAIILGIYFVSAALVAVKTIRTCKKTSEQLQTLELAGVFCAAAFLQLVFVIRLGGDFMHGRMILLPLFVFCMLFGFAPLRLPKMEESKISVTGGRLIGITSLVMLATVAIGIPVLASPREPILRDVGNNIVANERDWYTGKGKLSRLTAADYEGAVGSREFDRALNECAPSPRDCAFIDIYAGGRVQYPRLPDSPNINGTVMRVVSLGAVSVDVPLSITIRDLYGLSDPVAGRTTAIQNGRIGHSKQIPTGLAYADSDLDPSQIIDPDVRRQMIHYRELLEQPEVQEFLATYRDPLTPSRFFKNIWWALSKSRHFMIETAESA